MAVLIALLLLLPLTLVVALDVVRSHKSEPATFGASFLRVVLSLPLTLLALLALAVGIAFAAFLIASWPLESPRAVIGGLIAGALFLGFGIKLLRVLWSRKHQ